MKKSKLYWILGLGVIGVSIFLRISVSKVIPTHLTPDSEYYHQLALNLSEGKGFSLIEGNLLRPVHEHTPGYSLFLAGIYLLIGSAKELTNKSIELVRVIQIQQLLTLVTIIVFGLGFFHLFKHKGWVLAYIGMSLIYFPYVVAANYLLSETLGLFLFSLVFWGLVYRNKIFRGWVKLLTGLLLGALVMVRPAMIVVLPAYGFWLLFYGLSQKLPRVKSFSLMLFGFLIPIILWIIRTGVVTSHWIPVQVGVTRVLVDGGCPGALCGINYANFPLPIDRAFLPITPPSNQFNPINLWWWYNIKKIRNLLGFPFGYFDLAKYNLVSPLLSRTLFFEQILILGFMISGGLIALRRKNYFTLPTLLLMGGIVAHSLFWSEPRYALMYMPLVLGIALHGLQVWWSKRLRIRNEITKHGLTIGSMTVLLIIMMTTVFLAEIPGWSFIRIIFSYSIWLIALGTLLFFGFRGMTYKLGQKMTMLIFILMMWGLLISLWQPIRLNLWEDSPKNDYLFPVGIFQDDRQWL